MRETEQMFQNIMYKTHITKHQDANKFLRKNFLSAFIWTKIIDLYYKA